MGSHGFAFISLLTAVLFLVFLVVTISLSLPRYTSLEGDNPPGTNGSANITDPIEKARSIATQADLKSIQTGLNIYYSEYGQFPASLSELNSQGYLTQGVNVSSFAYQVCNFNNSKVLVYKNSPPYPGFILDFNGAQDLQGGDKTTCT